MPHAHLTVYHLLKRLESDRAPSGSRDKRPEWLVRVIETAAECFEPAEDIGRVGFVCCPTEQGWVADLYLGSEEQWGGANDGWRRPIDFRFNLARLKELFDEVAELRFDAVTAVESEPTHNTRATIRGRIENHPLTIHIHALPPQDAKAGFRRYADGRREMRD